MNPPDRTSPQPPPQGTAPDRTTAPQNEPERRITRSMRRRLEAQPEGEAARFRARQRQDTAPNTGTPDNAFVAAAAMQRSGPARSAAASGARTAARQEMTQIMVSVRDGFIGSFYMENGRIRTTHVAGPGMIEHTENSVRRFHIDEALANAAFQSEQPDVEREVTDVCDRTLPLDQQQQWILDSIIDRRNAWLGALLMKTDTLPPWAQHITGPESLPDIDAPRMASHRRLFEVIDRGPDEPASAHISRGEMVQMTLPRREIGVLGHAIQRAEQEQDPARRNRVFFAVVERLAPDLARRIRRA